MVIRILVADDHSVVRVGLRSILESVADFEIVGEAGDGPETLRLAEQLAPDVILLDISMPKSSGFDTAREIASRWPDTATVILTVHEDEALLHEALEAGSSGYVVKRAEPEEIIQAVRAAHRGDLYVHPAMTRLLLEHPPKGARDSQQVEELTPREVDVLRLLAKGNTNRQAARLLGLSIRTIENHRANLMGKLGVISRVELVSYANTHGLSEGRSER